MKSIILILPFIITCFSFGQNRERVFFNNDKGYNLSKGKNLSRELNDQFTIIFKPYNHYEILKYQLYSKDTLILEMGDFICNDCKRIDTIVTVIDPLTFELIEVKSTYVLPLKNDLWFYFNEKGCLMKTENWDNGVLISTTNITR